MLESSVGLALDAVLPVMSFLTLASGRYPGPYIVCAVEASSQSYIDDGLVCFHVCAFGFEHKI